MSYSDVFVIGAGPAGLTASYLLTKQGVSTTVIEADPVLRRRHQPHRELQGLPVRHRRPSLLLEVEGSRRSVEGNPAARFHLAAAPAAASTTTANTTRYPLKAFEALNNLGVVESAICVLSFMYKQAFPNEKPETFHEWVANQFGERLFSIFFKTYTEKVWGMSCDEISADWAAQRIKGLDLWTAMANALRNSIAPKGVKDGTKAHDGEVIKTLIESFEYPRKGPGMMWDAAAAKTRAQGGTIHMGTTLDGLSLRRRRRSSGPSRRRQQTAK